MYFLMAWYALFASPTPRGTALLILSYAAINVLGASRVGREGWFGRCEAFAVLFHLFGSLLGRRRQTVLSSSEGAGIAVFTAVVLAALIADAALSRLQATLEASGTAGAAYAIAGGALLASVFVLALIAIMATVGGFKLLTRTPVSLGGVMGGCAQVLLPLVVALWLAHNFTLVLAQASQLPRLLSDPFGRGWDLAHVSAWNLSPVVLDAHLVWTLQIGILLAGQIWASVLVRRRVSLWVAGGARAFVADAVVLLLLLLVTTVAFWALSMPDTGSHEDLLD
jgi:hypothetical protein